MTNEVFSDEDLCRLESFLQNVFAERKQENASKALEGWEVEKSISARWKSKLGETSRYGSRSYLSPDGQIFPNRLKVLQHMLTNAFPQEEVDAVMRQLKKWEGWQDSEFLPHNWIMKEAKTRTRVSTKPLQFLSPKGDLLKSIKSVLQFLQKGETYDATDVHKMRQLNKRLSQENKSLKPDWSTIHWLPEGWTFKSDGTKTNFCSPSGKVLHSRRECLQLLLQNGDGEAAEKMLESLVLDNWKSDRLLPKGWRFKKTGENEMLFITPDGDLVDGINNARAHIARVDGNSESKDLQNLELFWEIESSKKKGRKRMRWKIGDETVPSGWMVRPSGKLDAPIKSPTGLHFVNRLFAENDSLVLISLQASSTAVPHQRREEQ